MKFFAVFAALIAVTCASPSGWTLNQLSEAIQSPYTSPAYLPYLEHALNEMMTAIYAGDSVETVTVGIPSVDYSSWTLAELSDAIENPDTNPALLPGLEQALNQMMDALISGAPVAVAGASTVVPAQELSFWTLAELSAALESPETSPVVVPYLVDALNHIMHALISGEQMDFIVVATPVGILPVADAAVVPVVPVMPEVEGSPIVATPVVVAPGEAAPVEATPVEASPVEAAPVAPAAPSSPLVQIIVNINQQSAVVDVPVGPAVVAPAPVIVEDAPQPINIVEQAAEPINVVDQVAEPINVVESVIIPTPVIIEQVPESVISVDNSPIIASPVVVAPESPGLTPDPESVASPGLQPDPELVAVPNPIDVIAVNA